MPKLLFLIFLNLLLVIDGSAQVLPTFNGNKTPTKPQKEKPKSNTTKTNVSESQKGEHSDLPPKKFILKIVVDADAILFVDGKKTELVKAGETYKLLLERGVYDLKMVSQKSTESESIQSYKVTNVEDEDIWRVGLKAKDENYFNLELINILKSYIVENYTSKNDYATFKHIDSVWLEGSNLIFTERKKYYYNENGKLAADDLKKYRIDLKNLKNLKIYKADTSLSYSDSILFVKIIGEANYSDFDYRRNKEFSNLSQALNIPVRTQSKIEFEAKIIKYLQHIGIAEKPTIYCSYQQLIDKVRPCLTAYKYIDDKSYISTLSLKDGAILDLDKEYGEYNSAEKFLSGGEHEHNLLFMDQFWDYSFFRSKEKLINGDEGNVSFLILFGKTEWQWYRNNKPAKTFNEGTNITLPIKDGCRVVLESYLKDYIHTRIKE